MNTLGKFVLMAAMPVMAACGGSASGQSEATAENQVIETIMNRRSIRKYEARPVDRAQMDIILQCGINAPNGMNLQPWEVRVVENPEYFEGVSNVFKSVNPAMADNPDFSIFRNAPTVAFVAAGPESSFSTIDCALLGENMVLAAASMGIGSCVLGGAVGIINSPAGEEYLKKLEFSEGYKLIYCIGFGYPAESPEAKPRDASKVRYIE